MYGLDSLLCPPPHPATMITTVFVSESPAISHFVDLHFAVVANLGMVGPGEATAFGAVVVLQGKNVDFFGVTTWYFSQRLGQFRRVFLDRLDRSLELSLLKRWFKFQRYLAVSSKKAVYQEAICADAGGPQNFTNGHDESNESSACC